MTYSQLINEKSIENFINIENAFRDIEARDITEKIEKRFGTEALGRALFIDRKLDGSSTRAGKLIPDGSTSNLVNANRSSSTETGIYNKISELYGKALMTNKADILKFIANYVQSQISNLATRGPNRPIMWSASHDSALIEVMGAEEKEIKRILKESPYMKSSWLVPNKPSNCILSMAVYYYFNHPTEEEKRLAKDKYKNHPIFILNLMLTIRLYSSLQWKYFRYGADEELMNYVMDNISGRYKLKEFENMFEYLRYIAYSNVNNTVDVMNKPTDHNYHYYLNNLDGRINSTVQSLAREYYAYVEEGKNVTVDKTLLENDEGKQYLNNSSNISNDVSEITRKIIIKLSSNSTVDISLLEMAVHATKMKLEKMKTVLEKMIENDQELIGALVNDIVLYYLVVLKKDKKTIRSMTFIKTLKDAYSISNTEDKVILHIKQILDSLLKKNSEEYLKNNRAATLSHFRHTIYLYFILYINKNVE
jgi:hypothetical protein